jgi:hypothetical protein
MFVIMRLLEGVGEAGEEKRMIKSESLKEFSNSTMLPFNFY